MDNNSVIGQKGKKEDLKGKSSKQLNSSIWGGVGAFIMLSGAIGSLQHIAEVFADDIDKTIYVQNWMPWFAVSCFALGWFITHWIEVVLHRNQLRVARVLFILLLVGGVSLSVYFHYNHYEVLQSFDSAALFMAISGNFLRLSVFRQENVLRLRKAIFGRY